VLRDNVQPVPTPDTNADMHEFDGHCYNTPGLTSSTDRPTITTDTRR
jgi:hypothetical protein